MMNKLAKTCAFCNEIDVNMKDITICRTCKDHIINTSKEFKYWIDTYYIDESQVINYISKEMNYKIDLDIIKTILSINEDYLSIKRWLCVVSNLKKLNIALDYIHTDGEVLLRTLHNDIHKAFMEND